MRITIANGYFNCLFYLCRMKRITATILLIFAAFSLFAGTPIEDLMGTTADIKGAQLFEGKGFVMKFARAAIRKTPMKPLADQVTEVTVCKIDNASTDFIKEFTSELRKVLKGYQFYGVKPGEEGHPVEVYGNYPDKNIVREIVVYNPDNHSLFSLRGEYTVEELLSLDKKDKK